MATLAEIRAKLAAMDSKPGGSTSGGDNAIYPFWNISEGTSATLRFLPDGDPNNTFFWTERQMIRLQKKHVILLQVSKRLANLELKLNRTS